MKNEKVFFVERVQLLEEEKHLRENRIAEQTKELEEFAKAVDLVGGGPSGKKVGNKKPSKSQHFAGYPSELSVTDRTEVGKKISLWVCFSNRRNSVGFQKSVKRSSS